MIQTESRVHAALFAKLRYEISFLLLLRCSRPVPAGQPVAAAVDLQRAVRRRPHEEARRGRELLLDLPRVRHVRGECCLGGREGGRRAQQRKDSFRQGAAAHVVFLWHSHLSGIQTKQRITTENHMCMPKGTIKG